MFRKAYMYSALLAAALLATSLAGCGSGQARAKCSWLIIFLTRSSGRRRNRLPRSWES